MLALLHHYSTLARQESSARINDASSAHLNSKASDISASMDETTGVFDDATNSILETSTASFSDFMFGEHDKSDVTLNDITTNLSNSLIDQQHFVDPANIVSSRTASTSSFNLPPDIFDTFDPTVSTLDPHIPDLEPPFSTAHAPFGGPPSSLHPFYNRLNEVSRRWDTMNPAEQLQWRLEE